MAKKAKDPVPYLVIWKDIVDDDNEWKRGDVKLEPQLITTVALLIKKEKDKITLVRDHYVDEHDMVTGGRLVIPRGVIVEMHKLVKEVKHETGRNPQNGAPACDEGSAG